MYVFSKNFEFFSILISELQGDKHFLDCFAAQNNVVPFLEIFGKALKPDSFPAGFQVLSRFHNRFDGFHRDLGCLPPLLWNTVGLHMFIKALVPLA